MCDYFKKTNLKTIEEYCQRLKFIIQEPHLKIPKEKLEQTVGIGIKYATYIYNNHGNVPLEMMLKTKEKHTSEIKKLCNVEDSGNIKFYLGYVEFVANDLLLNGNTDEVEKTLKGLYFISPEDTE